MATEEGCVDLIRTVKHGIMDERATAAVPRPIRVPGALGEMMREEKEEEDGFTSASADPNGWLHFLRDSLKEESEDEYEELQVPYVLSSPSGYSSPTLPSSSPPRKPYGIYLFLNHGVSFSWTSLRVLCYICDVGCWFPVLLERKARTRDRNVLPMGLLYTLFGQTAGTSSGQLAGYHRFLGQEFVDAIKNRPSGLGIQIVSVPGTRTSSGTLSGWQLKRTLTRSSSSHATRSPLTDYPVGQEDVRDRVDILSVRMISSDTLNAIIAMAPDSATDQESDQKITVLPSELEHETDVATIALILAKLRQLGLRW